MTSLTEHVAMTCLAWYPKPLTPSVCCEHFYSGADHCSDFPARVSSLTGFMISNCDQTTLPSPYY